MIQDDKFGPSGASSSVDANGHSLLDGAYNEEDSAASFQQALMAWRQGEGGAAKSQGPSPQGSKPRPAAPVRSPAVKAPGQTF